MKKRKNVKDFIFSSLLNLAFNLEWTVPAWIFLALHIWKGISLWWFMGCIVLWVIFVMLKAFVFGSLIRAGNYKDPPQENKNPYSHQ